MNTAEPDKLSTLNDDCVDQILDRLPLRDICHFSRTCKRFHTLCARHFDRNHSVVAAKVRISVRSNGKWLDYKDYVRYFSHFIKELDIYWSDCDDKVDLSYLEHFIKSKCHPNLHKIKFLFGFLLRPSFCEDIEGILRNVKVIQFYCRGRHDGQMTEAAFLRYCPNLTKLIIDDRLQVENVTAILRQNYGQLNSFYYLVGDAMNLDATELRTFFQTNDRIRCVAWTFDFWNEKARYITRDRAVKSLRTLDYASNLQHLFLKIQYGLAEKFDQIYSVLDALCDRANFETLEVKFEDEGGINILKTHTPQLAKWKQLTKIQLESIQLTSVLPALRQLVHLRILFFRYITIADSWTEWSNWDELVAIVDRTKNIALPQIEEVQLEDMSTKIILSCAMQFARHWVNLKRFLVPACGDVVTTFHIADLNRTRRKLSHACELRIITDHKGNATNLKHRLVKLKLVKFVRDFEDPLEEYRYINRVDKCID